jgi:hypothetical protein
MKMKWSLLVGVIGLGLMTACNGADDSTNGTTVGGDNMFVPPTMPDSVYGQLKPGDIIIRKGNGPFVCTYHDQHKRRIFALWYYCKRRR